MAPVLSRSTMVTMAPVVREGALPSDIDTSPEKTTVPNDPSRIETAEVVKTARERSAFCMLPSGGVLSANSTLVGAMPLPAGPPTYSVSPGAMDISP